MIHDHEALRLASAALDFDLSAEEQAELEFALRECGICRQRAAAYRKHVDVLAALPLREASVRTRHRVANAAATGRAPMSVAWAPIALTLLLLGAIVAGAVGSGLLRRDPLALVDESPTPAATPTVAPSATSSLPRPSATATGTDTAGSPVTPAPQPVDLTLEATARVVTDNLRVRSEPRVADDSALLEPLLQPGDRVYVVAGPVVDSGFSWYQVVPFDTDGDPDAPLPPAGWVAAASKEGEPWVTSDALECPTDPDISALAALGPIDALACYRGNALTVEGRLWRGLEEGPCGEQVACRAEPLWLYGTGTRLVANDAASAFGIVPEPGVSLAIGENVRVRVTGQLDHPAASDCREWDPETGADLRPRVTAALWCRATFVATSIHVLAPLLEAGTVVQTITDDLRMRSLPEVSDRSELLEPLLSRGRVLWVLSGPVTADGYDWYEVVTTDLGNRDGWPMAGWVAVASQAGEAWIGEYSLACIPGRETHVLSTIFLGPAAGGIGLFCYGSESLPIEDPVEVTCVASEPTGIRGIPTWLVNPSRVIQVRARSESRAQFTVREHPSLEWPGLGPCDDGESTYQLEGHFGDAAAETCSIRDDTADPPTIDERAAVHFCMSQFVVTRATLVGESPQ